MRAGKKSKIRSDGECLKKYYSPPTPGIMRNSHRRACLFSEMLVEELGYLPESFSGFR